MAHDPFINAGLYTYAPTTFAQLPVATTVPGMRAEIIDSSATPIGMAGIAAAGGGTTKMKVQSDGTIWRNANRI